MVAQTRMSNTNLPKKLKFNDKLVGKGLTTDALLKKLKALHMELAGLDQDEADRSSLTHPCKELISTSILLHKDKGVKAVAACCLADLLRLFAPDAPYTVSELRDIFQFFFRQLAVGLKGSDSPYYNEYFHLLESLSTVKSVVLVCDLPQADELMSSIFHELFGLVKQNLAKNIEIFISDILIALIEECQMLPSDVLDILMAQFMDNNARMNQPAYRLAVAICNATSDKLQRHVCQYFTDNIVQHGQSGDFEEVERCHTLIKHINHACPSLLHNVVPQLEEELRIDEMQLRLMATQVLGDMFADNAGGDLEKKYPSTWALWLARKSDKAVAVRLAFVEGCKGVLALHRSELQEELEAALGQRLLDPDEKVRVAVCKVYAQLDYETSLHHVSEEQLRAVAGRAFDKKQCVRQEALSTIGRLYNLAYPDIENNDSKAIRQFSWIPQEILHSILSITEVKPFGLRVLSEYILPLPTKTDEEVAWTDRLLTTMKFLDDRAINTILSISNLKLQRPTLCERYIQCCIENNGGIIDSNEEVVKRRLSAVIHMIAMNMPDNAKVIEDLQTFSNMNEQRLYKLLKTCIDTQTDLKSLVKAMAEFSKRVEQNSPLILSTMMSIIRHTGLWIVNQSSIPTLVKRLQKVEGGVGKADSRTQMAAKNAQVLLKGISKHCPSLYRLHTSELAKAIADEKNKSLVEISLQALAAISRQDSSLAPTDKRTIERVGRYARGSNIRHAKFAARLLAHIQHKDEICLELVEYIADNLSETEPDMLVAYVAVLVQIVRFVPEAFEQKSEVIIEFLLRETLLQPSLSSEDMVVDDGSEWMEENDLPPLTKAKILALKLCRHRCIVHAVSENALDIASPVLQMFSNLLKNDGLITEREEDPRIRSRLRLQAARSLLQLATIEKFADAILPRFVTLVLTIQDTCFSVRMTFLNKLLPLITERKLHPRYNIILFLTAHDPEAEVKDTAQVFVTRQFKRSPLEIKLVHWELIFMRLIHLLAHHPDFGLDEQAVKDLARHINFYLDLIATSDNIPLLYNVAQKCKTIRDMESHTFSERLYAMSELAQELVKERARSNQWSLPSYPGKIRMPSDIFRSLPSVEAGKSILQTVYLPGNSFNELVAYSAKDKPKTEKKNATKRKAVQKSNGSKRPRAPKRRKQALSDDEESIDDDDQSAGEESRLSSPPLSVNAEPDTEEDDEEDKEDLGRGARSRAKVKAKKVAKRKAKNRQSSSGD